MDPDANLAEQRAIRAAIKNRTATDTDRNRLADLVEALSGWARAGGFVTDCACEPNPPEHPAAMRVWQRGA